MQRSTAADGSPPTARPPPHLSRPDRKPWLSPRTSDALPLLAEESALKRTPPDMAREGSRTLCLLRRRD
jgi:hypothetical protein